jgi:putative cell wall-binding protein
MELILQQPEFVTATFYVRDASGNVMAVYKTSGTTNLTLEEQHIYGSSRLGIFKKDKTIKNKARALGERRYELTDHLWNVRVVLSDYKKAESIILSATDYYPFGMVARTYTSPEEYRY